MALWGKPLSLTYTLNESDELVSIHGPWDEFAVENNAPKLTCDAVRGRLLWDFIAGAETRHLYRMLLGRVRERRAPVLFSYRCDAPDAIRHLSLRISSEDGKQVQLQSVLRAEQAREPSVPRLFTNDLEACGEIIAMCSMCKRVRVGPEWRELDEAVHALQLLHETRPFQISHGLCSHCSKEMSDLLDSAV